MKRIREVCESCNGLGGATYYKIDESVDDSGFRIAHAVREECTQCGGNGYIEKYVLFTVEEAKAILKYCGLSTES